MSYDWINTAIDTIELRQQFGRKGRLRITNILEPTRAVAIQRELATLATWTLCYIEKGQPHGVALHEWDTWGPTRQAHFLAAVNKTAASGFQFLYLHHALTELPTTTAPDSALRQFQGYLQSWRFIEFLKSVTGSQDGVRVDAHAARFSSGHFLNRHNDSEDPARRIAYVFNFTPEWRADWGGTLHFMERDGTISDSFAPLFNSLVLFRVPVLHYVAPVAAFSPTPRLSITGWLYAQ